MRFAAISDVHGNIWALEAVLDDVRARGIRDVVNLGDSVYGPLEPADTASLLRGRGILSIRGNEDRIVLQRRGPATPPFPPTLEYTRSRLGADDRRWLRSLRPTAVYAREAFLCHGTIDSDELYLLERVSPLGVLRRAPVVLLNHVKVLRQRLVLCGHSHVPGSVRLPDGSLIVNAGSVGLPAYQDDFPFPHCMEAGTPHARYAVLTRNDDGFEAETVTVAYEWERAAEAAERRGRPDWAAWLRTGRAALPETAPVPPAAPRRA